MARGDSKAIGNVAAGTVVVAGSMAAATATGAAVRALIGGALGLVVGVGVAYGAEISSSAPAWMAHQGARWMRSAQTVAGADEFVVLAQHIVGRARNHPS